MSKQKRKHANPIESRLHFAAPHIDGFQEWLRDRGYTASTIEERVRLLAGWTDWMHASGFALRDAVDGLTASATVFKGKKSRKAYVGAGRLFIQYLQDRGALPKPAAPPSPAQKWPMLGEFLKWARQHRGIAETTLELRQRSIIDLLHTLGDDPSAYTATALRGFMLDRAKRYKVGRMKNYAVPIRGFLRFLVATERGTPASASASLKTGWKRRSGATWRGPGTGTASAGSGGVRDGCTNLCGCTTATRFGGLCRKLPQHDRPHNP